MYKHISIKTHAVRPYADKLCELAEAVLEHMNTHWGDYNLEVRSACEEVAKDFLNHPLQEIDARLILAEKDPFEAIMAEYFRFEKIYYEDYGPRDLWLNMFVANYIGGLHYKFINRAAKYGVNIEAIMAMPD